MWSGEDGVRSTWPGEHGVPGQVSTEYLGSGVSTEYLVSAVRTKYLVR